MCSPLSVNFVDSLLFALYSSSTCIIWHELDESITNTQHPGQFTSTLHFIITITYDCDFLFRQTLVIHLIDQDKLIPSFTNQTGSFFFLKIEFHIHSSNYPLNDSKAFGQSKSRSIDLGSTVDTSDQSS